MKVIDLRMARIDPEMGEEVTVESYGYTYTCIVEGIKDISVPCDGCLLDRLQKCEYIICSERYRKDRNDIILKCISRKRREVENA